MLVSGQDFRRVCSFCRRLRFCPSSLAHRRESDELGAKIPDGRRRRVCVLFRIFRHGIGYRVSVRSRVSDANQKSWLAPCRRKLGILIKGGQPLEIAHDVTVVCFDILTLTLGKPSVVEVFCAFVD